MGTRLCLSVSGRCPFFDFTSDRWHKFLVAEKPLTILLGIEQNNLPAERIVRYPQNREITSSKTSGPIPCVEVCLHGPVAVSAVASCLLVCAVDSSKFAKHTEIGEATLANLEAEYDATSRVVHHTVHGIQGFQDGYAIRRIQSPDGKS
jgi:hypothetical protein